MLILTRKRNDSIRIGDNIVVRVMRTAKGSVKIGIEAPDSVRIVRGELNDAGEFVSHAPVEVIHEICNDEALLLQH